MIELQQFQRIPTLKITMNANTSRRLFNQHKAAGVCNANRIFAFYLHSYRIIIAELAWFPNTKLYGMDGNSSGSGNGTRDLVNSARSNVTLFLYARPIQF